jgi:co-chaperonin GroES (HSP10)
MRTTKDLIIVKLSEKAGAIIIPDSAKESMFATCTSGVAEIVGPDCKYVKKGDFIHYNSYVGNEIKDPELKGGIYMIVSENDVFAIR